MHLPETRRLFAKLFVLIVCVCLLCAGGPTLRAQEPEPTPTLVITQPTPFATPDANGGHASTGEPEAEPTAALSMHDGAVTENASVYVISAGDTLLTVALELGLDVDEMGCVIRPDFDPTQPLVIGDQLAPLPAGILCHRTGGADEAGESVRDIATLYGVNSASILGIAWNGLESEYTMLPVNRFVRVPHAGSVTAPTHTDAGEQSDSPFLTWMLTQPTSVTLQEALTQESAQGVIRRPLTTGPVPADWKYGSGVFVWPTYGWLTQGYRSDHRAIDIAATIGTPVTAADRGVVLRAGWNNQGYGNFVIIDHNIDYLTLYAHLNHIFVQEGEIVAQGQILGTVGSTGNSTGPHLHFEIRDFGRLANPLEFLGR